MLVLKLLLVCFGYHAPCGCVACVFSRCTQNRVNSHQVVQIAGSYLNTYPCILGRMIPVLTKSCFPTDFLALVLNSYSWGTSCTLAWVKVCMSRWGYTWGKNLLASQIKRWALSWPWPFRRRNCHHRWSLLSTELVRWQQSRKADEPLGSVGKELKENKSTSMLLYKPVGHPWLTTVCGLAVPSDECVRFGSGPEDWRSFPAGSNRADEGASVAKAMAGSRYDRPAESYWARETGSEWTARCPSMRAGGY